MKKRSTLKNRFTVKTAGALAAMAAALTLAPAHAAVIYSEDFESSGVGTPGGNAPNNWASTDFVNTGGGPAWEFATNTSADDPGHAGAGLGDYFGVMLDNVSLTANLGASHGLTFVDNTTYTLRFTHFRRDEGILNGEQVRARIMTSGGTVLATQTFPAINIVGNSALRYVTWTVGGGAEIGQNIQIDFFDPVANVNLNQAGIDNIFLSTDIDETFDASPEPSTLALLALGAAALSRARRGYLRK